MVRNFPVSSTSFEVRVVQSAVNGKSALLSSDTKSTFENNVLLFIIQVDKVFSAFARLASISHTHKMELCLENNSERHISALVHEA